MARRRNVMLLIADDWSPLAGCYGSTHVRTPAIDGFAAQGTTFEHAYCASPSCAASRATILTGQHSHTHGQYGHSHGIHGFRTHERTVSIPGALKPLGYACASIGKLHAKPEKAYPFDVWERGDPWSVQALAGEAGRFLDGAEGRPFYLHVGSAYPHRLGDGFGIDRKRDEFDDAPHDPARVPVPGFLPDTPAVRGDLAHYVAAVERFDRFVGGLLDVLQRSGRAAETLVIVMSDHGMPFPGAKASSYESGHHCPLLVRHPDGAGRGERRAAMVSWVDLAPTVYDFCGVPEDRRPELLAGRSILPVVAREPERGWDEVFYSHSFHEVTNYFPYRALRRRRYKYVLNLAHRLPQPLPSDLFRSPTWTSVREGRLDRLGERRTERFLHRDPEELLDLERDPHETENRIGDPALAETVVEMRRALLDFRIRTKDPWLETTFQLGGLDQVPPEVM